MRVCAATLSKAKADQHKQVCVWLLVLLQEAYLLAQIEAAHTRVRDMRSRRQSARSQRRGCRAR